MLLSLFSRLVYHPAQRNSPRWYCNGQDVVLSSRAQFRLQRLAFKVLQRKYCSNVDERPSRLGSNLLQNVYRSAVVGLVDYIWNWEFLVRAIRQDLTSWQVSCWFACVIFGFLTIQLHTVKWFYYFPAPLLLACVSLIVNDFVNHEVLHRRSVFSFCCRRASDRCLVFLFLYFLLMMVPRGRFDSFHLFHLSGDEFFHARIFFCWGLGFLTIDGGWFNYFLNVLLRLRFWCKQDSQSSIFLTERSFFSTTAVWISTLVAFKGPWAFRCNLMLVVLGLCR